MNRLSKTILAVITGLTLLLPATAYTRPKAPESASKAANTVSGTTYYMELRQTTSSLRGNGPALVISFGEQLSAQIGFGALDSQQFVQSRRLGSLLEAMNYLTDYGWQLEQCYTVMERGTNVTHWILSKRSNHPMELLDGIANTNK